MTKKNPYPPRPEKYNQVYTRALGEMICICIAEGKGMQEICEIEEGFTYEGKLLYFPFYRYALKWQKEEGDLYDEFRAMIEFARKQRAAHNFDAMQRIADSLSYVDKDGVRRSGNQNDARAAEIRIATMKWRVQKDDPKYNDKTSVDLNTSITLNLGTRLDAAVARVEARKAALEGGSTVLIQKQPEIAGHD